MRSYVSALVAALFVMQAAPAAAAEEPAPKAKKERKICKAATDTGTRMVGRTCLTPTQWRQVARRDKQNEIAEADGDHLLSSRAEVPVTANPR